MNRKIAVLAVVVSAFLLGFALAQQFGMIRIGYRIEPSLTEAPTLTPNPIQLDLGTLKPKEARVIDYGKVANLTLPIGYSINFTLNLQTVSDFTDLEVKIGIYNASSEYWVTSVYLHSAGFSVGNPVKLNPGTYVLSVEVECTAANVTEVKTGYVEVSIFY